MHSKLIDDHARIRELCAELIALISADRPCPPEILADCRWRLASLVLRHLPVEDRNVFQRLERHPDPAAVACGERFKAERENIYGAFQRHADVWTPEKVTERWAQYGNQVRRLLDLLQVHMEREEVELYPLVDDVPDMELGRRPEDKNWAAEAWTLKAKFAGH